MTQMHQLLFYSHYSKKICMQDTVKLPVRASPYFFYAANLPSLKRMQAPARKSEIQPFRDGVAESLDRLVNILRRHKHGI